MIAAMPERERCHLRAHVHARWIILALPPGLFCASAPELNRPYEASTLGDDPSEA